MHAASGTFVAPDSDPATAALNALYPFVARHPRLFVLTGAGLSTASGIPGYRDESGAWMRAPPITWQAFASDERARRRYWARSLVGWPLLARAQPNAAHRALAGPALAPHVHALVTQNVDGLHQRAGSEGVIELHGSIGRVICLDCGAVHARASLQPLLRAQNPALAAVCAAPAADGDADLDWDDAHAFRIPVCAACGGRLKPDVVFYGENVPRERVEAATRALDAADALLVIGSSLMVYSGYRFCVQAQRMGKPIAALNLGVTRADALLALKIDAPCVPMLEALAVRMGARGSA